MTDGTAGVLHVLGSAAPGDTTTAAARALRDALAAEGVPGRLATVEVRGTCDDVSLLRAEDLASGPVVVHTVDGGHALAPVLAGLTCADLHLVHHGSRPGSDRSVLRSLRDAVSVAAGTDASAREELRGLGFGEPAVLPSRLPAGSGMAGADSAVAGEHPGPYLLAVGPITHGRSLELLVDAFAQLLLSDQPSAVLSICGPADRWYLDALLRRVVRRGLVACEVIEPGDEDAVRTRLDRCDAFVAMQPVGFDPYLWYAASRAAVVATRVAATAALTSAPGFVQIGVAPTRDDVVRALHQAASAGPVRGVGTGSASGMTGLRALLQVA